MKILKKYISFVLNEEKNKEYDFDGNKFSLPAGHLPVVHVPEAGTSCATCKFSSIKDGFVNCGEPNFLKWNKDGSFVVDPKTNKRATDGTKVCSDWWTPQEK